MPKATKKILTQEEASGIASFTRRQLDELIRIYRAAEREIQKRLSAVSTHNTRARNIALLNQVEMIISALQIQLADWSQTVIPKSYQRGVEIVEQQTKRLEASRIGTSFAQIHQSAITALVQLITMDGARVSTELKHVASNIVRRTQLAKSIDDAISREIALGVIEGKNLKQQTDALLSMYRARVGAGEMININGTWFRLDKYMELVARTRTRDAVTQGTINTALQYGFDLVVWDIHDNPCPKCRPFTGRVFSITGEDTRFPLLVTRPPVHPNCECTIHPTTEIKLRESKKLDEIVALSNNPRVEILGRDDYEFIIGKKPMQIAEADATLIGGNHVD